MDKYMRTLVRIHSFFIHLLYEQESIHGKIKTRFRVKNSYLWQGYLLSQYVCILRMKTVTFELLSFTSLQGSKLHIQNMKIQLFKIHFLSFDNISACDDVIHKNILIIFCLCLDIFQLFLIL